jgi:hypothetical protein
MSRHVKQGLHNFGRKTMKNRKTEIFAVRLASPLLMVAAVAVFASDDLAAGIVASIDKASVTADGNVTGVPTNYVITLEGSLDHKVPGRSLKSGDQIKVFFPPEFDLGNLNPAFPLSDVPASGVPCVPGNLQCTTAVILQGWPQEPFFPPALFHTLSIDPVENAFVFTAVQDLPANPGIKQLLLILHGVTNPSPGHYRIRVEAQTGPGGAWESGSGLLQVLPRSRPSVNITSVLVKALSGLLPGGPACGPGTLPPNPDNPVFQVTAVNSHAPFTWTFLLWGHDNEPLDDVVLRWVNPNHALLLRGNHNVGHIYIDAPHGATGYGIDSNPLGCPTKIGGAPVIAGTPGIGPQPVGRLDLAFRAGSEPGEYTTTISLNNGNSVQMTVTAE